MKAIELNKTQKRWKQPVIEKLNVNRTKGGDTNKKENKPGTQGPGPS